ncbi:hypothetical protein Nwi_0354 [Nitrobacter winogradskyi Nb-255]|uniref:Uncharacterized protein n=1 Tax=Nitrobacter winogradskyi (strain ATCC 25391 / DSM 10237 / CIP 104748 / NCIMB 11846 / Nb-255) TaxID=323098 RepID=Q3SVS0_NITWN|nr:hypothetical protein [Nitrobacter winogradskyi]ABA03621.1 hypothetical protein Nwi_0354 [Nitrobacter winogradskyi Nb-255]
MRKLIAFDDETMTALTQLGHDRMATLQDLADEAFADLLKKHAGRSISRTLCAKARASENRT